ncbi:PTS transporter subunit EIIB [Lactobacillus paragasseri]|uniref:PTS transporter subunit EIIC n=1 Tax=Lactobacillus TaxID=1578 RepID=UPI000667BA35|nr:MULTISPECIES: PTS transporter subunit EIIC [Lactobacillus]MDE3334225.1 PTS transporter subunit EIIB [Lactobacillus paragasseri]MDE3383086.1 PTS transporter subunit EIIB [Lactobacillus paragasseri]MDE3398201.1 PTS transporter subunit EIIB [Lactobacillus paragasseri]MDK7119869.1 PTS transporter subunit EIIB [Lactobacillus paragasseri]MDX5080063.1 PTS transporter subunit EIIB [Lactobacillus paragasseri]
MNSNYQEVAKKILVAVGGAENIDEVFNCIARLRFYLKDSNKINYQELELIPEVSESKFEDGQLQILLGQDVEKYYQVLINLMKQTDANRGVKKMSKADEKNKKLAEQIVKLVGGKDNVISLVHCVTRLRFKLKDEKKANDDAIKQLKGVMGVAHAGGQYQVIIGNNVADVYDQVMPLLGLSSEEEVTTDDEKDGNIFSRLVALISSLFMPLLGVMTGAGMLKGLLVLLNVLGWVKQGTGTYMIWNAAADSLFYFLPVLLGFSAAKTFHVNKYLGAVTGGALVYPTMVAAATAHKAITFFGLPVNLMNYSQTMLPIVFAIWGMSWFEKGTKKVVPKVVQNLFVPLLDLMVIVPLTYLIVGPVMQTLSQWLSSASLWLYGLVPVVAGFVIGGIWQAAVIVGLHWAFIPVLMNNLMTNHFDPINGIMYCTLFGQVGAALAMGLKAKDKNFKEIAIPAAVSGFFGVTEPIIYGVTLPHKKSFVFASIGSAFGGAIAAAFHAGMYTMPGGGIFGIPAFINPKGIDASFIAFVISLIVAFALAFILTFIWGDKVVPATPKKKFDVKKVEFKDQGIAAPIQGTAVELLIHLGINTVNLKGKYFDAKVAAGQKVKQGDLLETFDVDQIKAAGYDTVVPIIVTNTNNFDDIIVEKKDGDSVKFGDQILMATVDQEVEIPVNATQA